MTPCRSAVRSDYHRVHGSAATTWHSRGAGHGRIALTTDDRRGMCGGSGGCGHGSRIARRNRLAEHQLRSERQPLQPARPDHGAECRARFSRPGAFISSLPATPDACVRTKPFRSSSATRCISASPYGAIHALDATTGAEKWKFQLPEQRPAVEARHRVLAGRRRRAAVDHLRSDSRAGCTRIKASDGTLNDGFGENGVVTLKTPEVMQTGMDVGLLAAVVSDHLQEPDHHRRGHRRRTGRLERRSRAGGRYARLGRQDRQAGVDVPYRAAARGVRLRHLGREQRQEPVRRQRLGLHVARRASAASSTCRSARRTTTASAPIVPATICSRRRWSRSMRTPASISGTSSSCITTSGTTTRSRRRCSST